MLSQTTHSISITFDKLKEKKKSSGVEKGLNCSSVAQSSLKNYLRSNQSSVREKMEPQ